MTEPIPGGGWVPVPDPTILTTEQLHRELAKQRELLELQVASLKELAFQRFDADARAVASALMAADRAVAKAELAQEKRLEGVNEFRQQLSDQAAAFITRRELDARGSSIDIQIDALQQRLAELELRLTSRLDRGSGEDSARAEIKTDTREEANRRTLMLGVIVSVVVIVVNIIIALSLHGGHL